MVADAKPFLFEVGHVEGMVLFEAGGESRTLLEVTVATSEYNGHDARPVASSVTQDDGHFSIADAAPGRCWLSVSHKALIGFSTELRLRCSWF